MPATRHPLPDPLTPPWPDASAAQDRGQTRTTGLRRIRRMSNWTAAALLAGTGAATVALATQTFPATSATTTGSATTGSYGATAPHAPGAVVTSGGSGSTATTTTRAANGKTIVAPVRNPAAYHDS